MTRATPFPETVTLHVPFRLTKRGGRKEMQMPDGAAHQQRTDSTLIKALARAFRWKQMLESGELATITDLAQREGIAPSYLTRILRLTFLAPDIIEAILEGQARSITAQTLRTGIDDDWDVQRRRWCVAKDVSGMIGGSAERRNNPTSCCRSAVLTFVRV